MTNHPNRSKVRDWPAHLKAFRSRHALTQQRLADLLHTTVKNIENWEAGRYDPAQFLKRALRDVERDLNATTPAS